ncbi:hypothetical protein BCR33DRAFT_714557 [Rhizoclosmatium globosum]|uniref:Uncharacterized protein n=1 Tax=Rhizoclosmatium globosum TaxID=329046 RepID=A0A1Y2CMS5_9FUNG|nr:hypothetical protein BCR33DRAFT_714557 [Rhizoclosmatium globosum]|eukprot:ORY48134.1 hypothetical protein BCR33DRAFT_714557 [Rhizoclosmatium globosum]
MSECSVFKDAKGVVEDGIVSFLFPRLRRLVRVFAELNGLESDNDSLRLLVAASLSLKTGGGMPDQYAEDGWRFRLDPASTSPSQAKRVFRPSRLSLEAFPFNEWSANSESTREDSLLSPPAFLSYLLDSLQPDLHKLSPDDVAAWDILAALQCFGQDTVRQFGLHEPFGVEEDTPSDRVLAIIHILQNLKPPSTFIERQNVSKMSSSELILNKAVRMQFFVNPYVSSARTQNIFTLIHPILSDSANSDALNCLTQPVRKSANPMTSLMKLIRSSTMRPVPNMAPLAAVRFGSSDSMLKSNSEVNIVPNDSDIVMSRRPQPQSPNGTNSATKPVEESKTVTVDIGIQTDSSESATKCIQTKVVESTETFVQTDPSGSSAKAVQTHIFESTEIQVQTDLSKSLMTSDASTMTSNPSPAQTTSSTPLQNMSQTRNTSRVSPELWDQLRLNLPTANPATEGSSSSPLLAQQLQSSLQHPPRLSASPTQTNAQLRDSQIAPQQLQTVKSVSMQPRLESGTLGQGSSGAANTFETLSNLTSLHGLSIIPLLDFKTLPTFIEGIKKFNASITTANRAKALDYLQALRRFINKLLDKHKATGSDQIKILEKYVLLVNIMTSAVLQSRSGSGSGVSPVSSTTATPVTRSPHALPPRPVQAIPPQNSAQASAIPVIAHTPQGIESPLLKSLLERQLSSALFVQQERVWVENAINSEYSRIIEELREREACYSKGTGRIFTVHATTVEKYQLLKQQQLRQAEYVGIQTQHQQPISHPIQHQPPQPQHNPTTTIHFHIRSDTFATFTAATANSSTTSTLQYAPQNPGLMHQHPGLFLQRTIHLRKPTCNPTSTNFTTNAQNQHYSPTTQQSPQFHSPTTQQHRQQQVPPQQQQPPQAIPLSNQLRQPEPQHYNTTTTQPERKPYPIAQPAKFYIESWNSTTTGSSRKSLKTESNDIVHKKRIEEAEEIRTASAETAELYERFNAFVALGQVEILPNGDVKLPPGLVGFEMLLQEGDTRARQQLIELLQNPRRAEVP